MTKRKDEIVDSLAGDEGGAVGHWPGVRKLPSGAGEEIRWDPVKGNIVSAVLISQEVLFRLHPSNRLTMLAHSWDL